MGGRQKQDAMDATEEAAAKDILLALVEPQRDALPADVTGWRFGETAHVCSWTGVTCDPADGTITGLNLGNGFYAHALLGMPVGDQGSEHPPARRAGQLPEMSPVTLRKERHHIMPTGDRRATDAPPAPAGPSFPSSLGRLRTLRFLNLSSNQIRGTIPKSVTSLPNLEIFDVSSNYLEGTFPHFASDALRVLDVSKNRFHGRLDEELFGHPDIGPSTAPYLMSLVKFDLSHNGFNGTIPLDGTSGFYNPNIAHEESMQNLKYFDLAYNLFSGTICNNFGNFENLEGLFLEHNRLVGTIPKSLFRGSGIGANPLPLTQLYLQQNALSGTLNEGLATLPDLKEIFVDANKLTGKVPEALCAAKLNNAFLYNDTEAARGCDGISCPANSASKEGVAPCKPCPDDGGFHRYLGQHGECKEALREEDILDLFFGLSHGNGWALNSSSSWDKGSPACQREGVECNARGQVAKIALPSMGLRGPIASDLGFLSQLRVLDLSHNQLTGFLPSDLRFAPLRGFDIRGSRIQGVVPPLMCIKEGVNDNGIGPSGVDLDLFACEHLACPRGTFSRIGRATLPEKEGERGIQCLPCYDDEAALYIARDQCTDISIAGMQIRRKDVFSAAAKSISIILALGLLAFAFCILRRRKLSLGTEPRANNGSGKEDMQRWASSPAIDDEDEYSGDDWTAGYSEAEGGRPETIELTRSNPPFSDVI